MEVEAKRVKNGLPIQLEPSPTIPAPKKMSLCCTTLPWASLRLPAPPQISLCHLTPLWSLFRLLSLPQILLCLSAQLRMSLFLLASMCTQSISFPLLPCRELPLWLHGGAPLSCSTLGFVPTANFAAAVTPFSCAALVVVSPPGFVEGIAPPTAAWRMPCWQYWGLSILENPVGIT